MKNILFGFSVLLCVALLIFGKVQYDNKLKGIAQDATASEILVETEQVERDFDQEASSVDLENLHPELQEKLQASMESGESLRMAVVGSNAMVASESEASSWPDLVIEELTKTYGTGVFDVATFEVGDLTTSQLLVDEVYHEMVDFQPDVLLFEPLILNDNGSATMDITLPNIASILAEVKSSSPDVFVVLQPPNPIYQPNYYLQQVRELEAFAEENDYMYLNHWEAWPDINDQELNEYIEGTRPNGKGHEVWASAVIEFFTGK